MACLPDCLLQDVKIGEARMLLTHGHQQNVKTDRERLQRLAVQYQVQTVLYGHTHVQRMEDHGGILLVNPGAAAWTAPFPPCC